MTFSQALALFDYGSNPEYSIERARSSMKMLDSILAALYPAYSHIEDAATFLISPNSFPKHPSLRRANNDDTLAPQAVIPLSRSTDLTPDEGSTRVAANMEWNVNWTQSEIQREEMRRICWGSLKLGAAHLGFHTDSPQFVNHLSLFRPSKVRQSHYLLRASTTG